MKEVQIVFKEADERVGKAAEFWIGVGLGMMKARLFPNDELQITEGGPTDEGHDWTRTVYRNTGQEIEMFVDRDARDCDGSLRVFRQYSCPVEKLESVHNEYTGLMMPDWEQECHHRSDLFAESMGY